MDQNGVSVAKWGNPLTGPFFVEGAESGDVLVVTLVHVTLNRNFATTLNSLIPKIPGAKKAWRRAKLVRWRLDLSSLTGSPADSGANLRQMVIPLHPFLGCVGVAPDGDKGVGSGASGTFGGNLVFGIESTLDKSLKAATGYLLAWVQTGYPLSLTETSQIIGPAIEYRIPKIAATKVEVVAILPKAANAHLRWQNQ